MDIQTAISKCLNDLSLAQNTVRNYTSGLRRFAEFLTEQNLPPTAPLENLTIENFIAFMPWLDKLYAKQTAHMYNTAAGAFLNFLVIEGALQIDYVDGIRYKLASLRSTRRRQEKLPRWPKKDDVSKMQKAVREYTEESPRKERNIALIEFLASSGCRISEIIALNIQDIDLMKCSAIVMGKGSKERRVFFSQAASDALRNYWSARKSGQATDPVFARHDRGAGHKRIKRMTTNTARNIVKNIAGIAGIDPTKFSPHYFRHAFAIRVLSETGNLALTQDLLGHTDPKSTRNYAKIEAEDLQKAHAAIFNHIQKE